MHIAIILLSVFIGVVASAQGPIAPGTDLISAAKRAFQSGNVEQALRLVEQGDTGRQPSSESLDLRGSIYLEQGKFDEAAKTFKAAHEADPALFLPRLHQGDVLFLQKKYGEAREVYEQLSRETNILMSNERLRFGILLTYLAEGDKGRAESALARIKFPTETPAYYFSQAAWAFAKGEERAAKKWMETSHRITGPTSTAWFMQKLHHLGWLKDKPPPGET